MNIQERIEALRAVMKENGVNSYIIPSSDNHMSEYVNDHFKCREWISGFTGSAGTVVITDKEAHLWVDGRYHIQGERQVAGTEYIVHKLGQPNVDNYIEWLGKSMQSGEVVAFNGKVVSVNTLNLLKDSLENNNVQVKIEDDFIQNIWVERIELPKKQLFIHETKYCGKSCSDKLSEVRKAMDEKKIDSYLITSLDDIAWLLNLRGGDVENNPVFLSYVLVDNERCSVYLDTEKVTEQIREYLANEGVGVKEYADVASDLSLVCSGSTIGFDPNRCNVWLLDSIDKSVVKKHITNITTELKAIKNEVELANLENCQIKDGVAMVKFIKWLKENVKNGNLNEVNVADKLEKFRSEQPGNLGISFDSISAYKENAAMMHYKATEENKANLEPRSFYLIDSGGQYYDGTTDITRTIALGELTEEEKTDFTLVLKGHIALSNAKFLYGITGVNLDILARQFLWNNGIDYKCGTGHGVGFLLNVHEGPQGIAMVSNGVKLEEGMILTNEPGVYKEGKHGIRTENTLVVKPYKETEFGKFLKFETISYCPIDLKGVKFELLTDDEKNWLNEYHNMVYTKLKPYLSEEEVNWLHKEITV